MACTLHSARCPAMGHITCFRRENKLPIIHFSVAVASWCSAWYILCLGLRHHCSIFPENFGSNHRENFPDASIFLYRKYSILLVTGADELFEGASEYLFICICSVITFFCLSLLRHQGAAWTIQFCWSPCSSADFDFLKIKHLTPWIRDKKLELQVEQQRQLSRDVFSNFYFSRMSVDLMGMTAAAILTLTVYQRWLKHLWTFKACKKLCSNP